MAVVGCTGAADNVEPEVVSTQGAPDSTIVNTIVPVASPPAPEPVAATTLTTPEAEPSATNPLAPPSRRTDVDDVDLVAGTGRDFPNGYNRAAVPVDAWAARTVLVGQANLQVQQAHADLTVGVDDVVVTARISSCELISVWALPHPDQVVVGFEEYPSLTCVQNLEYTVLFVVPLSGVNSEGEWAYPAPSVGDFIEAFPVPIHTQVRVGVTE
jgi:hypothetical protein